MEKKFNKIIFSLISQIPKGKITTYANLSNALGDVKASRAIAKLLSSSNELSPKIPFHRVVYSDGIIRRKKGKEKFIKILKKEGITIENSKIINLKKYLFFDFDTDFPLKKLREKQIELKDKIILEDRFNEIDYVGGVDVAYSKNAYCACAIFDYKNKKKVEQKIVKSKIDFPYIPTYLSYREFPIIKKVLEEIESSPTILMVDGNGVLHPFGVGLASYTGVILNIPTIGVAKSLLCGKVVGNEKVSKVILYGKLIGYALKKNKKPIFVSPGNKISFETALRVVKNFQKYRIPEPIREAHLLAKKAKFNFFFTKYLYLSFITLFAYCRML